MQLKWWQRAVFYQIYPRSFADGNGDGIGDFPGMIERLDYLQDLGINALWLSPHYPSPQYDCGYDVSDYTGVAPEYGTLQDFQRFLHGAHERGMRVILDWVPNHTSDQHPWFIASKSSRMNPKRDWYVWRRGDAGQPPNNWYSAFGGPAWEYDPHTGEHYYHFFFKHQPDLNWHNPQVKRAMFDGLRFWLDQGVDGFRLDAIGTIFEDPTWTDNEGSLSQTDLYRAWRHAQREEDRKAAWEELDKLYRRQVEQPETHQLMQELRYLLDRYPDRVLVGEDDLIEYYGDGSDELHLVFNFPLMRAQRLTPDVVRRNQAERLSQLPPGAWPCNTLGNHDADRVFSRYADGRHDVARAKLALALMLTLRGTPFLYYGEEIGMTDLLLTDLNSFRDNLAIWHYQMETQTLHTPHDGAVLWAARFGRDKCRTPMQWSDAPNGGFSPSDVQTWLPVNPNYALGVNVASQLADPDSLLHFYRRLLRVRRETPALVAGDYEPLQEDADEYLAFLRVSSANQQTCLVVLNMSDRSHKLSLDLEADKARLVFSSTARANVVDLHSISIAPFEVLIAEW